MRAPLRRQGGGVCAGREAEPPLNAVRQALKALEDLRAALRDCAELDHRIAAMEHDKQGFAANVDEIGQLLGIESDGGDAGRLADVIEGRVARAREDERRRQEKTKALAEARLALGTVLEALAVSARLGSAMMDFFGVGALAQSRPSSTTAGGGIRQATTSPGRCAPFSRSISQTRSRRLARPCRPPIKRR